MKTFRKIYFIRFYGISNTKVRFTLFNFFGARHENPKINKRGGSQIFFQKNKRGRGAFIQDLRVRYQLSCPNMTSTRSTTLTNLAFFYRAQPNKSLHLKNENCVGGKHSKLHLTGLTAANAVGEKLPLFVIGKSKKPRCFKHLKHLPCRYRSQKKS